MTHFDQASPGQQMPARISWLILAALAATIGGMAEAAAQNYPWCAQYGGRMGGAMNCGFVSFEQCMETVRGMGGFCIVNNTYVPPAAHRARKHYVHKHHVHKKP